MGVRPDWISSGLSATPLDALLSAFGLSNAFRWNVEKLPRCATFQQIFVHVEFSIRRRRPHCPGFAKWCVMLAAVFPVSPAFIIITFHLFILPNLETFRPIYVPDRAAFAVAPPQFLQHNVLYV
jgi:hypothetical protein